MSMLVESPATVEVSEEVARGVALLDEKLGPGWPSQIDVGRLDIARPCDCVLGQVWPGGYGAGIREFGGGLDHPEFYDSNLTAEWRSVIGMLRETRQAAN